MLNATADLSRSSFIGKEKDKENNLGDFGMRKYEDGLGRFTSIDPLWEKYYGWTPYQYCTNNPLVYTDTKGLKLEAKGSTEQEDIKNGLPEDYRDFVRFDENGVLDKDYLMSSPATSDENVNKLIEIARNEKTVIVKATETLSAKITADDTDYSYTFDENYAGTTTFPKGQQGDARLYSKEGDKISVQYDPTPKIPETISLTPERARVLGLATELYGHTYLFMTGQPFLHIKTGSTDDSRNSNMNNIEDNIIQHTSRIQK